MEILKQVVHSTFFNKGDFLYIPSQNSIVQIANINKDSSITLTIKETDKMRKFYILSQRKFQDLCVDNLMEYEPIVKLE
jgi:hypothetical protein